MAGWAFSHADVARHRPLLPAERIDLGTYSVLPHHRTGASAACREPFRTSAPARATLTVEVPLESAGSRATAGPVPLLLRGPGDVLGLDPRQIIRRYPEPGTGTAEASDLVHCEFDRPDLPWLFTPTAPDAAGRLPPWLRLVVVRQDDDRVVHQPPARDGLPPTVSVPIAELPSAEEAWAWAHTQVIGPTGRDQELANRLDPGNPALNLSRLLCPRRLEPRRSYLAMVVPTFEAGRLAGLGQEPVQTLQWSWPAGGGDGTVQLPVYDSWSFSTGDDGDFETLARRLRPVAAPPGTGRRLVDTTQPGLCLQTGADARPREVLGPLVRPADTPAPVPDPAAAGVWDQAGQEALAARLDAADSLVFDPAPAEGDPELAPPLYGGTHRAVGAVPDAGDQPAWLRQLNLDPAHRIAAGLGAAVARMDAEALMASAWGQLPDVLAANEALRLTQFSRYLSRRYKVHLDALDDVTLLAVTQRSQARVLQAPGMTVRAVVSDSATPVAATAATMRRLARPAGPLRRFGASGSQALLGDGEQLRDWVLAVPAPDGTERLGRDSLELLVQSGAAGAAERADLLAGRSLLDELGDGAQPDLPRVAGQVGGLVSRLLLLLPPMEQVDGLDLDDPRAIAVVFAVREVLPDLMVALEQRDLFLLTVDAAQRHRLEGGPSDVPGTVEVPAGDIRDLVAAVAQRLGDAAGPWERDRHVVQHLVEVIAEEEARLHEQLDILYQDCVVADAEPAEAPRARLVVGDLRLREHFDPARTLDRRIRQRIPGLHTALPGWLDNGRFDPVMAAPSFHHPMFEALHRLDPEWLLPGVGGIEPREMVTTLETNPVFVEAFLVGLNHEFARELVWRGYPTDGRGTSFRSFWTRGEELADPIHRMAAGDLGSHLSGAGRGKLVYVVRGELVRRYPQLHAQVVRQHSATTPIRYTAVPVPTLFQAAVGPDVMLVGVDLEDRDVLEGPDRPAADGTLAPVPPPGSLWLTLSEHVGEPRFGLDEGPSSGAGRDDLAWADWPVAAGHLPIAVAPGLRPPGLSLSSAVVAWLLYQLPARAGFRARRLMLEMGDPS
jgi:hypothetical protein